MKKYIASFMALLTALGFCVGCDEKANANGSQNSSNQNQEQVKTNEIEPLVKNGVSSYTIVLPEGANEAHQYAASEIADFVNQSTGANMNIVTDDKATYDKNNCYISLGKTDLLEEAKFNFDYTTLNGDGFFIKTVGNMVFIDGERDRGVLYGAYDFLEKNVGVRFLSADATYLPKHTTIKLYETNDVEIPDFSSRIYLSSGTYKHYASPEFMVRSRQDYSMIDYVAPKYGEGAKQFLRSNQSHNMIQFVDYNTYHEEHPEFFVEVPPEYAVYGDHWRMICLTNGITDDGKLDETMDLSVAKIVKDEMKKDILNNPNAYYFGIEQSDGSIYCECDRCTASWEKYTAAGTLVRFVNVLAEEIKKEFEAEGINRDFRIQTFAYGYTRTPPVKVVDGKYVPIDDSVIVHDNVTIRIAMSGNAMYPLLDERAGDAAKNIRNWRLVADEFTGWFYDKDYNDYISYFPSLGPIKQNVLDWKEAGFSVVMIQAAQNEYFDWQSDLHGYIYRNLLWDSTLNAEDLYKEFIELYFGETVAPYVDKLIQSYEQNYAIVLKNNPDVKAQTSALDYLDPTKGSLSTNFLNNMIDLMLQAREALEANTEYTTAEKNMYRKRVAMVQTTPTFTMVRFFAKYYPLASTQERQNFYIDFFKLADEAGLTMFYEIETLAHYKQSLGVV